MARRSSMPKFKDKKVFSHTAVKGKKINVTTKNSRGGTWL